MIAEVIIDLKSKSVDKTYSYLVPEELLGVVEVGERVFVEFSSFKRMGIIIALKEEYDPNIKLKEIIELLDIEPVITKELIELGKYLAETSIYPLISYLLTMIPASLKVNYSKKYILKNNGKEEIDSKDIDKFDLALIKEAIKNGDVEARYDFKKRESIKLEKYIRLNSIPEKLSDNRKRIVDYLIENKNEVRWLDLRDDLNVSLDTIKRMEEKGIIKTFDKEVYRTIDTLKPLKDKNVKFTEEQEAVFNEVKNHLFNGETYLLHGITGSGKTEIYLALIEETIKRGREAIVLVPEISLTPMMVNRFKSRFKDNVAIFHSELSNNTRYDEWRKVLRGEVKIAVGARSAIFTPFKNIGIIIIDEEHEQSYKQDNAPIYHAKDVAEFRTKTNNATLLLGSATPSIESYARAKKGVYNLLELKNRANNLGLPKTIVVDLNDEFKAGNHNYISRLLESKILTNLEKGNQSLLLLNRRGYSSYVMCRSCGSVRKCPNCDVSLTYHAFDNTLKCHYCNYEIKLDDKCHKCGYSPLEKVGYGTEKLEEELNTLFPNARIVRMDNDTTRGKNGHEKVLYDFEFNGDILIGTQMIAKGLDFPNVTLVGVINADQSLSIPDFRSKETTFSLLTQVSGRAGRGDKKGEVVIQTYSKDHYAIKYALKQDYIGFYNEEMKVRKVARFIPFYNMNVIRVKNVDLRKAYTDALMIKNKLEDALDGEDVIIMGPIAPTISKVDTLYIFNVIIKYKIVKKLNNVLKNIFEESTEKDIMISLDKFPTTF